MYKHMYRKLYIEGGVGADLTYQQLEQLIKGTKTTNHNVMELDRGHIEEVEEEDEIDDCRGVDCDGVFDGSGRRKTKAHQLDCACTKNCCLNHLLFL